MNLWTRATATIMATILSLGTYVSMYGVSTGLQRQQEIRELLGSHFSNIVDLNKVIDIDWNEEEKNRLNFKLSDGSTTTYTFSEPVLYKENGELKCKDLSIEEQKNKEFKKDGYEYSNGQNDYNIHFSKDPNKGLKVSNNKYEYSISAKCEEETKITGAPSEIKNENETVDVFDYKDIYGEGTLLRYYPQLNGIKEDIILNKYTEKNEFEFVLNTKDCYPEISDNGSLLLLDNETKEKVEEFTPVFAYDAKGNAYTQDKHYTKDCKYEIEKVNDLKYILTIKVSKEFLTSKDTVYPVTIDPVTNNISNSMDNSILSGLAGLVLDYSNDNNFVGKKALKGVYRSLIKFDMPSEIKPGATINSAYYWAKELTGTSTDLNISAHMVTNTWSNSTKWRNQPSFTEAAFNTNNINNSANDDGGTDNSWFKFNVKNAVTSWNSGTTNNGFVLKSDAESSNNYRAFAQLEYSTSSNRPYTVINYTNETIAPTIESITGNSNEWKAGTVNLTVNGASDSGGSGLSSTAYSFSTEQGVYNWQASNVSPAYNSNQTIYVYVRDNAGNITACGNQEIKVDNDAPTISNVTGNPTSWTNENVTLQVNGASDNGLSGLNANPYSFSTTKEEYNWQAENTSTFSVNQTVYIYVRDVLGNVALSDTVTINKVDKDNPVITSYIKEKDSAGNITLSVNAADTDGSGIKDYSFDNGSTWQASNQKTFGENLDGVKVKVRDNVGNIGKYTSPAPTNLKSIGKTDTTVALSWNASTDTVGVAGYNIYNGENFVGYTTDTSYVVTGLSNLTTYDFKVEAVNTVGDISTVSNTLTVTTGLEVPTNVTATASSTSIKITWDEVYGVSLYDVQINDTVYSNISTNSYVLNKLSPNTTYSIKVRAKSTSNTGNWSSQVQITTKKATIVSGVISQNVTWSASNSPYIVNGDITIQQGATLTIEPGTIVKVEEGYSITVNGVLNADGTADSRIVFTSEGDLQYDGTSDYYWQGIFVDSTGQINIDNGIIRCAKNDKQFESENEELTYSVFSYGKLNLTNSEISNTDSLIGVAALSDAVINNNIINSSVDYGIYIASYETANISIKNNQIESYGKDIPCGIVFESFNAGALDVQGNVVKNSDGISFGIDLSNFTPTSFSGFGNNTFAGYIDLTGELKTNLTLNRNLYIFENDVTISQGKTLTIQPGCKINIPKDKKITVNGILNALGTVTMPIVFTSESEQCQSAMSNDYWGGINVGNTGELNLDNAKIEYAGGSNSGNVIINSGKLSVTNSQISNSFGAGIYLYENNTSVENTINIKNNQIKNTNYGIHLNVLGLINTNIENNLISSSNRSGVYFQNYAGPDSSLEQQKLYGAGSLSFKNNIISNSNEYSLCADNLFTPMPITGFETNQFNDKVKFEFLRVCQELTLPSCDYVINKLLISNSAKLNVQKGTIINNSLGIYVIDSGELNVEGTEKEKVVIKSTWEPSQGNNSTSENSVFASNGTINLKHVKLKNFSIAICAVDNSKLNMTYSTICNSGYGIYFEQNSNTIIKYNSFVSIYYTTLGFPELLCDFDISHNYWGSYKGPRIIEEYTDSNGNNNEVLLKDSDGSSIHADSNSNSRLTIVNGAITDNNGNSLTYSPYYCEDLNYQTHFGENGTYAPTGTFSRQYTDMIISSNSSVPFEISRTYNSKDDRNNTAFGKGWTFNYESNVYDYALDVIDNEGNIVSKDTYSNIKVVRLVDGSICTFTDNGDGTYTAKDSRNELTKVDGKFVVTTYDQIVYGYNADNKLFYIKDKNGNVSTVNYNTNGKISTIVDCTGRTFSVTYTGDYITSIKDMSSDRTVIYQYNSNNKLERVIDPTKSMTTYAYDQQGYLIGVYDNSNKLIAGVSYNHNIGQDLNKVSMTTDGNGNVSTYTYDNLNKKVTITASDGKQIIQDYDDVFYMTKEQDAEGKTSFTAYPDENKYGEPVSITDRNGKTTSYERDANGNITKTINPDGSIKVMTYDARNNLLSEKDENGKSTYYFYDNDNNLLKKVQPLNGTDLYNNDGTDNNSAFVITAYTYYSTADGVSIKGLVKTETEPEGTVTSYAYDSYGNMATKTINNKTTHYKYSASGLLEKETSPKGDVTEYVYDNNGNQIKKIVDGNKVYRTVYDGEGNAIKEILPKQYDSNCEGIDNTYTSDVGTRYTYNPSGKVLTQTDALGFTTIYTYDQHGNVLSETLPNGSIYRYTYDALNRIKDKFYKESSSSLEQLLEHYEYGILSDGNTKTTINKYISDTSYLTEVITYDYAGRELNVQNADGTSQSTLYNANGTINTTTDELGKVTYYQYDGLNQLIGQWVPVSDEKYSYTGYVYDKNGRITQEKSSVDFVSANSIPTNLITKTYTYYPDGAVYTQTDNEGRKTVYYYDDNGVVKTKEEYINETNKITTEYINNYLGKPTKMIQHVRKGDIAGNNYADNSEMLLETNYTYDANGNLETQTNAKGVTITFTYDNLNRQLSSSTTCVDETGASVTITKSQTYDANGNVKTEKDANGNVTNYLYNGKGQLVIQTDANGGVTANYYDYSGRLVAVVSPNGYSASKSLSEMNRTEYIYDAMGRVLTVNQIYYDANASQWINFVEKANKYDAKGNVIKELNAAGYAEGSGTLVSEKINSGYGTEYTYDYSNQLLTDLDPVSKDRGLSYKTLYTYDALGRKVSSKSASGVITNYSYDGQGNILSEMIRKTSQSPEQIIKSSIYNLLGQPIKQTDANGNTTTYEYNSMGKISKLVTSGDSSIAENTKYCQYNQVGMLVSTWDNSDTKTEYTYDNLGRKLTQTQSKVDGSQAITLSYKYDKNGNLRFSTNGNGIVTSYTYDCLNRKITETVAGKTTTYAYDAQNNLLTTTDWRGNTYTNVYDALNRVIKKLDPNNIVIETLTYNNDSLQTSSTDALLHTTSFIYDRDGRLSTTKDPENYTTLKTYDNNGNISSTTDSNSNVTSFDYDEFNRLKTVTNALNEVTSYTYDGNGNMLTQTDAKGNVTTCEYNSANLMTKIIAHGGRTGTPGNYTYNSTKVESYSYFPSGKIATKTDKNGNVTSYAYDAHDRVLSTACGTLTVSFTYDNNGNVLTMTDSTGTTEKSYDEFNRLLTKNVPGIGTIEYVYDITNGINPGFTAQTTKYPSGAIVKKVYDKAGRLSQVVADNKTTQYNYYNNGSVQSVVYDGGASETYTYFADNQLETLVNKKADNTVIDSYSYTYDNANNMLSKTDSLGTTTYSYDALNRMLTESMQSNKTTAYTFDKAGNRASQAVTQDGVSTTTEYNYDSQNKLVSTVSTQNGVKTESVVYTYDYNGNNLEKRATPWVNGVQKSEIVKLSNTYDNFNQLVQSVTDTGVRVVNKYNGEGYRVEKTIVNGATTKYLYEGNKVVGEYDENGSQKAINVYGLNLLMRIDVFNDYYYMYNGHADVTALLSASGTVDATYYFDAFGNVLNKTGRVKNSILYAGYQYDEETGLYYINARMYDPAIARFVQEDTYRGDPNDPLSLNLYAYCNNNPIKYIDPSGHSPFPLANGDYFSNGRNAGKYNPYVQQIQTRLQQLGCLGYFSDATDGRFGPKTKKAVQEYQRRNGLKQDGCVGPITWSYLFPDNAGSSGGNSGSSSSSSSSNQSSSGSESSTIKSNKNQSTTNKKKTLSNDQINKLCRENKIFRYAKE